MRRIVGKLAAIMLLLATGAAAQPRDGPNWHALATTADRARLRGWRDTWLAALVAARREGGGAVIAAEGELLDPDAARSPLALVDGRYRCRVLKVGTQRAAVPGIVREPAGTCRIADGRFARLDGPQRPAGRLWLDDPARGVFLGSLALGDEAHALDYAVDRDRDMAGVVERIGERRWRLVLPRPRFEAMLEVIELVPFD